MTDDLEHKLELVSWLANRSHHQTLELFELCDEDFDRLLEVEARVKSHLLFYCPGSKEEVERVLSLPLDPRKQK